MVVAMLVIKNNIAQNNSKNQLQRVAEVLSQSDRVLELKSSLSMSDYLGKAREYVTEQFESAVQVRKTLGVGRQRSYGVSR